MTQLCPSGYAGQAYRAGMTGRKTGTPSAPLVIARSPRRDNPDNKYIMKNIIKNSKTKVYIDGANIFYAQKQMGWSIAWHKVAEILRQKYDISEFCYYTGIKAGDNKMPQFLKYLDKIGFTVMTKPLKEIKTNDGKMIYKSNFDVEITADLAFDRANFDNFILFSGDSDFDYIVKKMRDVGKRVVCFASRKTLSWELKLAVNEYNFLENFKDKFSR